MWKSFASKNMCTSPEIQSRLGGSYRPYSPTAMTNAYMYVIDESSSVRGAARKYGVPEATLRDRVKGNVGHEVFKSGIPPLFTQDQEMHLVEHLKVMAASGYGYSRAEVVDMASTYAVALGKRDEDHPLTLMWFYNFLKRWPELKVSKPRSLELQRAKATSEESVATYFNELKVILEKYDLLSSPERIYNVDEKGLKQNHSPPCIVTSVEAAASTPAVVSGKGSTVTVIGCGNALGTHVPPFFVFPGKRMRAELLHGCSPGADGTVTESGWSNSEVFKSYLQNHFLKFVQGRDVDKKILILYDGHKSHISLPLIDWAKEQNILLFILPAHTSHVLQPLDVGCFGPFERIYNNECHKFMRANACIGIDRYSVCQLACKAYSKALSSDNLRSAFRKSGIYPLDPNAVDKSAFIPAKTLKKGAALTLASTINQSTDLSSDASFFKSREDAVGQVQKVTKKRRTISTVVSGKAITEDSSREKIVEHHVLVSGKSSKVTAKKNATSNIQVPKPGPSNIKKRKSVAIIDSESSSDEEITEEEKCCVCHRFVPLEKVQSNSIYFTTWGQCMYTGCGHWTHLKYCCSVNRLSSKDTFYCPCHGVPCTPLEE